MLLDTIEDTAAEIASLNLYTRIFKNSLRTLKETHYLSATKSIWLIMFYEMISVCTDNHTKSVNTKRRVILIIEEGGTYNYLSALMVKWPENQPIQTCIWLVILMQMRTSFHKRLFCSP
jgi:hypothetical protein